MVGGVAGSSLVEGGRARGVVPEAMGTAGSRVGCMPVGWRRDSGLGRIEVVEGMGFGVEEGTGSAPAGRAIGRRSCSILGPTLFGLVVVLADRSGLLRRGVDGVLGCQDVEDSRLLGC